MVKFTDVSPHIGNAIILISFTITNLVYMRLLLLSAGIFFGIWAVTLDYNSMVCTFIWNGLFSCVHIFYLCKYARAWYVIKHQQNNVELDDVFSISIDDITI